jgi:hypothetical protein
MSLPTVGLNLTALADIQPFNLSLNTSPGGIMSAIEGAGITYLDGFFGLFILSALLIILFWNFSDDTPNSRFRYTYLRSLNLALTLVTSLSMVLISIGFTNNIYSVSIFAISTLFTYILLLIIENKE